MRRLLIAAVGLTLLAATVVYFVVPEAPLEIVVDTHRYTPGGGAVFTVADSKYLAQTIANFEAVHR